MSWLFVALIPALLMLATFGLERLESSLCCSDTTDDEVKRLLERAKQEPVVERRVDTYLTPVIDEPGLPTRRYRPTSVNPQFQPTRHANRV